MNLNLSSIFVNNIHEVYPLEASAWLQRLPSLLTSLCTKWNVQLEHVIPELSYGFVAAVKSVEDRGNYIIKITPPGGPTRTEAKWLRLFPQVCPAILFTDENENAFLMERLLPGTTLKDLVSVDDEGATKILAQIIRKLQSLPNANLPSRDFKHLSELAKDLNILRGVWDSFLLEKAQLLFHDLSQPRSTDIVLHGDLHHDNILKDGAVWKVIDPHGYVGDPVFEMAPLIYNPLKYMSKWNQSRASMEKITQRRLDILKDELGFDWNHMKNWAFCMTTLSMAWTFEGSGKLDENQQMQIEILDQMTK